MNHLFLGVVADDFTGASDAASFLRMEGVRVILFNGIPADHEKAQKALEHAEAAVIALKSRTAAVEDAVRESMAAFCWLKEAGAEKLYFKYCSTFDSTDHGNIGPVADAVMDKFEFPYTVLCPALPVNGRTVKDGILYVNGVLLEKSPMKDHPLTPMRDSSLVRLMERQSKYRVYLENKMGVGTEPYYLVPDYENETQGVEIAERFWNLSFFTGGSGLAGALGAAYMRKKKAAGEKDGEPGEIMETRKNHEEGKALLIAGSCSAATLSQIAAYRENGGKMYRIDPGHIIEGTQTRKEIFEWIRNAGDGGLIYSSAPAEERKADKDADGTPIAEVLEDLFAELSKDAVKVGYRRIIIAGGETSGAVTKTLGYQSFFVGESVSPGVPVLTPVEDPRIRLVLKSGNFGNRDFFAEALRTTEK